MLVKFIKQCMDKNTNEMYYSGTVKEFDDVRAKEIIKTGYAIEFTESKIERAIEVQDTLVDPNVVKVDLESLTLKELKKCAKDLGLATTGTKAELIERINKG